MRGVGQFNMYLAYLAMRITTYAGVLMILLSACRSAPDPLQAYLPFQIDRQRHNDPSSLDKPYVVMVSVDGFRHDYARLYNAKNLLDMAERGFSVARLVPAYPTKTFPNHYTLVTGMYPSTHGLVSNEFYNPLKRQYYKTSNRTIVEDGDWYGGTPLWVLAEQQGMLAASFFWVGSEAPIQGIFPSYHYKYDGTIPNDLRVMQVLRWLELPATERPHFITLYFSLIDDKGHTFGPQSQELAEAVVEIDAVIGRLREGLAKTGLPVHLVVTSDHGMVDAPEAVSLDSIDFGDSQVSWSMPLMVYTEDSLEADRIYDQLSMVPHVTTYRKSEIPASMQFSGHAHIGEVIAITQPPYVISKSGSTSKATHGFDPVTVPEMKTIFYVEGPNIKPGVVEEASNVDVYPLIVDLLGLQMPDHPIDGTDILRDTAVR